MGAVLVVIVNPVPAGCWNFPKSRKFLPPESVCQYRMRMRLFFQDVGLLCVRFGRTPRFTFKARITYFGLLKVGYIPMYNICLEPFGFCTGVC